MLLALIALISSSKRTIPKKNCPPWHCCHSKSVGVVNRNSINCLYKSLCLPSIVVKVSHTGLHFNLLAIGLGILRMGMHLDLWNASYRFDSKRKKIFLHLEETDSFHFHWRNQGFSSLLDIMRSLPLRQWAICRSSAFFTLRLPWQVQSDLFCGTLLFGRCKVVSRIPEWSCKSFMTVCVDRNGFRIVIRGTDTAVLSLPCIEAAISYKQQQK